MIFKLSPHVGFIDPNYNKQITDAIYDVFLKEKDRNRPIFKNDCS